MSAEVEHVLDRNELTARQQAVLDYLHLYTLRHGYQPTVREIGLATGIGSPNGIMGHTRGLQKKGWITLGKGRVQGEEGRSRAIRFLAQPDGRPFYGFKFLEQPDDAG